MLNWTIDVRGSLAMLLVGFNVIGKYHTRTEAFKAAEALGFDTSAFYR